MDLMLEFRFLKALLDNNAPIPAVIMRMILDRTRRTVKYEHGNSRCPGCGSVAGVVGHGDPVPGMVIRYLECSGCGATLKSVELRETQKQATPTPEKIKNKGRRSKKRD